MAKAINGDKVFAEQCEKEARNVTIVDNFIPNIKFQAVTSKFYCLEFVADWVNLKDANQEWMDLIEYKLSFTPKMKFPRPVTESQRYGWLTTPLIMYNRNDRRKYCPLVHNAATKFESKLQTDKLMHRPKFTGIPFRLL